jgi:hypothetical protein
MMASAPQHLNGKHRGVLSTIKRDFKFFGVKFYYFPHGVIHRLPLLLVLADLPFFDIRRIVNGQSPSD